MGTGLGFSESCGLALPLDRETDGMSNMDDLKHAIGLIGMRGCTPMAFPPPQAVGVDLTLVEEQVH